MKSLGVKTVRIAQIKAPGDIGKRQKLQRVRDLSVSLRKGVLMAPVVLDADMKLIAGGDRLAASILNEAPDILAHVVACTPREAKILQQEENLFRRHSEREQKSAQEKLLKLLEEQFQEEEKAPKKKKKRKPGRPKTPAGKAIDKVAKELGKTPEALYMQQRRAKEKDKVLELKDFELFGCEIDQEFRAELADTIAILKRAVASLRSASRDLEIPIDKEYSVSYTPLASMQKELERHIQALQGMVPHSLCPGCKCQAEYVEACRFCTGRGWIDRLASQGIPTQLLDPNTVCVEGEFLSLTGEEPEEPEERKGPSVEEIMEELTDGTEGIW